VHVCSPVWVVPADWPAVPPQTIEGTNRMQHYLQHYLRETFARFPVHIVYGARVTSSCVEFGIRHTQNTESSP